MSSLRKTNVHRLGIKNLTVGPAEASHGIQIQEDTLTPPRSGIKFSEICTQSLDIARREKELSCSSPPSFPTHNSLLKQESSEEVSELRCDSPPFPTKPLGDKVREVIGVVTVRLRTSD